MASGPFSTLGAAAQGSRTEIVLTDALGDIFNRLLDQYGLTAFPRIRRVKGEELSRELGRGVFHMVNCANALDHFENPALALGEMILVCKAGGLVRIISIENEGEREEYEGLHQWNLQAADDGIWLWNQGLRANLLTPYRATLAFEWKYVDHGQTGFRIFEATLRSLA